jgi:DNA primase
MRRIDPQTVRKILDTADIVEVVSDFVNLKRRGQNYVGLCPFHNERTPSFSVSKARGICKCFSCGKGGNTVNFIMEIEQLSYGEALRWLAKKYNIEIEEQELTPEQLAAASRRESMLALNDFALEHFQHNLTDHPDGQAIGLAYFRARGITDAAIKRFRLGYALEQRDALVSAARAKGYSDDLLAENGLCIRTEHGSLYDRFRGRVIYPVFALSGKVLAFGGRTLRKDKDVAKYVNSPESIIYSKSRELYGMYQARRAIVQQDKCILVEGYMDVISMSQRGIENVVASSGTSLTEGQIAMIHRFTNNVTVVYDSDAAGIKASLRGIDMLLAEGLNIKVMLLPEGDDPDSFAQSHTLEEIQAYMAENETDFLRFKAQVLLSAVK